MTVLLLQVHRLLVDVLYPCYRWLFIGCDCVGIQRLTTAKLQASPSNKLVSEPVRLEFFDGSGGIRFQLNAPPLEAFNR